MTRHVLELTVERRRPFVRRGAFLALWAAIGLVGLLAAQEKPAEKPAAEPKAEAKPDEKPAERAEEKAGEKKEEKKDDKKEEADRKEEKKDAAPAAGDAGKAEAKPEEKKDGAEDEKKPAAADAAAPKPPEPKPPAPPTFLLRDGTRISGFPNLDRVTLETHYGRLVVPVADLVRVRFVLDADPTLDNRIREEIARLANEEFETREKAMAALQEIGLPALGLLKEALKSEDEEVKARAQTLIGQIEEKSDDDVVDEESDDTTPLRGEEDEVVTLKFTAKGRVAERRFEVKSQYGPLAIDRKDILSIVFQDASPSLVEVTVEGRHSAPSNNWMQTRIGVEKDKPLSIQAAGEIQLQNYGQNCGPEGSTGIGGHHFQSFPVGALVARVGKGGKPFLVGRKFKGKADASGKLMFAVAYRGNVTGSFQVKVQVEGAD
jgi:hypothetical protein